MAIVELEGEAQRESGRNYTHQPRARTGQRQR